MSTVHIRPPRIEQVDTVAINKIAKFRSACIEEIFADLAPFQA